MGNTSSYDFDKLINEQYYWIMAITISDLCCIIIIVFGLMKIR